MRLTLLVIFAAFASTSCSAAESGGSLDLLIVDGAKEVRRDTLGSPAVGQISYIVDKKYPTPAISPGIVDQLKQLGWQTCVSNRIGWEHFEDRAGPEPRTVFQMRQTYAKTKEFLVVSMQYFLPDSHQPRTSEPDNTAQYVIILHYDLSDEAVRTQVSGMVEQCRATTGNH